MIIMNVNDILVVAVQARRRTVVVAVLQVLAVFAKASPSSC